MRGHLTKELRHSILVWPRDLEYLERQLSPYFPHITYRATASPAVAIGSAGLTELLAYENPSHRRIQDIRIYASGDIGNVEISLGKDDGPFSPTVTYEITVEDLTILEGIHKEIATRIRSMRPWFYPVHFIAFKWALPPLLVLLPTILGTISLIGRISGRWGPILTDEGSAQATPILTSSESSALLLVLLASLFVVGFAIDKAKEFLFPEVHFCIGKQLDAFKFRQGLAYFVFGVIILGVALNIISSLISSSF